MFISDHDTSRQNLNFKHQSNLCKIIKIILCTISQGLL